MTIHNLAYQGLFPRESLEPLALPALSFAPDGLEFYGKLSFLKAGLHYADLVTTVSPGYAREIQTPELGFGLDGLLRARAADLIGILNGIDIEFWDPARDPLIAQRYDADWLERKAPNKAALQRAFGLPERRALPCSAWRAAWCRKKAPTWRSRWPTTWCGAARSWSSSAPASATSKAV